MTRCDCNACRARDDRRFWRIVQTIRPTALKLPPIPRWEGEPTELYHVTRKGDRT